MKLIYISHPYTGNEENNRLSARHITGRLSRRNPDRFVFINPLDLFQGQSEYLSPDNLILKQTLEILKRCDAAIFCEGWRQSAGCQQEFALAAELEIPSWDGVLAFLKEVRANDSDSDG